MAGIEILSEKIIYNTLVPEWLAIVACICLFVLWLIGFFFIDADNGTALIICMIGIVILSVVAVCSCIDNKGSINYIEYKATIDDSVSMNEFLDRYEILDQEGKIYTIKERE